MSGNKQKPASKKRAAGKSNNVVSYGRCTDPMCGKIRYGSRADAKHAAKVYHPGHHLSTYPCGIFWHFGHKPARVIQGRGWGDENVFMRKADHMRNDMEDEALECGGCGQLVYHVPGVGYPHDCEVVTEEPSDAT